MKILEFGDTGKRKIVLLHGFQCPWQVWEKYIVGVRYSRHSHLLFRVGACFD